MGGSSSYASYAPGTLEPLKPLLILPEVTDIRLGLMADSILPTHRTSGGLIVSGEIGTRRGSYNKKLLDPKEITSWWDLLKPKLKGKLGASIRGSPAEAAKRFCFSITRRHWDEKYITQDARPKPTLVTRDLQQGTDWLANGKILF